LTENTSYRHYKDKLVNAVNEIIVVGFENSTKHNEVNLWGNAHINIYILWVKAGVIYSDHWAMWGLMDTSFFIVKLKNRTCEPLNKLQD
jgi:hypothetical protein